ncbi:MAG: M20/M25/M40 family metallo-hydrolase [Bacteroidetes bacterium]|jgi:acetylornithine deacetylase|nr:M20/M25/M40 family metallo-hydrolase [Bacteroidota bacterium]MDA0935743.1 M20/M25/M40 family metallo-hydrolase [Bacteroidota bacterium]
MNELTAAAIDLLKDLIATPSFSKEENKTADRIGEWFDDHQIPYQRRGNNLWAKNKAFDPQKPTLLLNSHHDTVKPNTAYTNDPFEPKIENGKLYGLGSNDAGGALVSLIALFTHFYDVEDPKYNLVMAASAEEEIAGQDSLRGLLSELPKIDVAIVGEPTEMHLAVAEKGLLVFDAVIKGTPGHAAHPNDDNPIMKLPKVLEWFQNFSLEKQSDFLGEVKITVTQVNAGKEHNVIPASVNLVVDVRVNDQYSNEELAKILTEAAPCEMTPRSLHLNSSSIGMDHELVQAGIALGRKTYGSPTLSDQAALECPSLKMGPGLSTRSHSANEFIFVHEIEEAIEIYIQLLKKIL